MFFPTRVGFTLEGFHMARDLYIYLLGLPASVGPSGMPCQLMIGFFAYAKTLEINMDKEELEVICRGSFDVFLDHVATCDVESFLKRVDATWHSRDDVKKALSFSEYKKAQQTAAAKVEQMCKGVEKGQNLASDFNVESGELASMFIPGPFAIANHLITAWANRKEVLTAATASLSNL
ncbi:hypothetical protein OROGR_017097 [Orobanche gracilis]